VVVVRVQGEVDTATAPRMGQAIDGQLSRQRRVVLDLSEVEFMDLHGLAVLLRATRRTRTDACSNWCAWTEKSGSFRTTPARSTRPELPFPRALG